MNEITNPHDKVFKEIEKVKENCRDLIESTFPKELLGKLDLDTLENDNNSYIDKTLQEYYSDIVYNCEYNGDTKIKIGILFDSYLRCIYIILNIASINSNISKLACANRHAIVKKGHTAKSYLNIKVISRRMSILSY